MRRARCAARGGMERAFGNGSIELRNNEQSLALASVAEKITMETWISGAELSLSKPLFFYSLHYVWRSQF